MYNGALLKNVINDSGVKLKFIALHLGLSEYGLRRKIEGFSEFKNSEIIAITELLRLTISQRENIFFAKEVE